MLWCLPIISSKVGVWLPTWRGGYLLHNSQRRKMMMMMMMMMMKMALVAFLVVAQSGTGSTTGFWMQCPTSGLSGMDSIAEALCVVNVTHMLQHHCHWNHAIHVWEHTTGGDDYKVFCDIHIGSRTCVQSDYLCKTCVFMGRDLVGVVFPFTYYHAQFNKSLTTACKVGCPHKLMTSRNVCTIKFN